MKYRFGEPYKKGDLRDLVEYIKVNGGEVLTYGNIYSFYEQNDRGVPLEVRQMTIKGELHLYARTDCWENCDWSWIDLDLEHWDDIKEIILRYCFN